MENESNTEWEYFSSHLFSDYTASWLCPFFSPPFILSKCVSCLYQDDNLAACFPAVKLILLRLFTQQFFTVSWWKPFILILTVSLERTYSSECSEEHGLVVSGKDTPHWEENVENTSEINPPERKCVTVQLLERCVHCPWIAKQFPFS